MSRSIWKFPITGIPEEIVAPGLDRPCFVALQGRTVCVWAEIDEAEPNWKCVVTVHGTGHPIANDEFYIGTLMDGDFVWHYYTTEVELATSN